MEFDSKDKNDPELKSLPIWDNNLGKIFERGSRNKRDNGKSTPQIKNIKR